MTDERAFFAAIAAAPADPTPRLVYADWLDEHARPDEAAVVRGRHRLADPAPAETEAAVLARWFTTPDAPVWCLLGGDSHPPLPAGEVARNAASWAARLDHLTERTLHAAVYTRPRLGIFDRFDRLVRVLREFAGRGAGRLFFAAEVDDRFIADAGEHAVGLDFEWDQPGFRLEHLVTNRFGWRSVELVRAGGRSVRSHLARMLAAAWTAANPIRTPARANA